MVRPAITTGENGTPLLLAFAACRAAWARRWATET